MELKPETGGVCAAKGFRAAGVHAGVKPGSGKKDMALILCEKGCAAAAVYTQNKVQGAPNIVTKQHLKDGHARGILVNSGNANTCNPDGVLIANTCCGIAARETGLTEEDFIIASTGVIGQALPLEPFERGIPMLAKALSKEGGADAAASIMTTDTVMKEFAVSFTLDGKECKMGAIGKGSGMINPNMATMLVFITTDVNISPGMLQSALNEVIAGTLNQISVDGDTSTNDMTALLASGLAGNGEITEKGKGYDIFCTALHDICKKMSRALAADGEGATKLLECIVSGAPSLQVARAVSKTVIGSDLVKTAIFGQDANWGRVLCAVGYTPGDFSIDKVSLTIQSSAGQVLVCRDAAYNPYSEEEAARVLASDEIQLLIDMGLGAHTAAAWGCDLSYDYVKINGDYRT